MNSELQEKIKLYEVGQNTIFGIVEAEKENDYYIWVNGEKRQKKLYGQSYYKTLEEAKEVLLKRAESKLATSKRDYEKATERLHFLKRDLDNITEATFNEKA
jgi:hypothetical protein